jgi:hypothetical protein
MQLTIIPFARTEAGLNTWTGDEIRSAIAQAVKYCLSPPQGALKPNQPLWQYVTKAMYPHEYGNSEGLTFSQSCTNAGADFSPLVEFPILPGGPLTGSKNSKIDVGTDRVVLRFDTKNAANAPSAPWSYIYCGVITHHTATKVPNAVTGKMELPFALC